MKSSKKAIKVIKEFQLLVDKLIELKKLSNPVPEYKKGGVPECKMGMGELIYAKSFKDVLNEKIDLCSDECFNSVVNDEDFIKRTWDKNMFSTPIKEKEIVSVSVLVGGLPAKFTIDKNVITILDLDDK